MENENKSIDVKMNDYPDPTDNGSQSQGPFFQAQPSANASSINNSNGDAGAHEISNADDLRLAAQLSSDVQSALNSSELDAMHHAPNPDHNVEHRQHEYATPEQQKYMHAQSHQHPMSTPGQPQNGPIAPYPLHGQQSQYANSAAGDNASARKRTKVSRACDECRRKKIRCDATSESGEEQCSNCRRVGTNCEFSRIPQKRGPSKGYIKELSDRLNILEGVVQPGAVTGNDAPFAPMGQSTPRQASHDFVDGAAGYDAGGSRKRTYSSMSNEYGYPSRQSGHWGNEHAQQPRNGQSMHDGLNYQSQYEPNGLAPQPSWKEAPARVQYDTSAIEHSSSDAHYEWDDSVVDAYYANIHSTFPILSEDRRNLAVRVRNAPPELAQAFLAALAGNLKRSHSLLTVVSLKDYTFTKTENLLQLQTLLLQAVEASNRGPEGAHTHGMSLAMAVALSYSMRLHVYNAQDPAMGDDLDTDDTIGRRAWWSLFVLDRFHASSTSTPALIPDESAVGLPQDQSILGDIPYQLTNVSRILGHVSDAILLPDINAPGTAGATLLKYIAGEIERYRALLVTLQTAPNSVVFLTLWHIHALWRRIHPSIEKQDMLVPAVEMCNILASADRQPSPLDYHFKMHTLATLLELRETYPENIDENLKALSSLASSASGWDAILRDKVVKAGASHALAASVTAASQGLQHLADLATAGDENRNEVIAGEGRSDAGMAQPTREVVFNPALLAKEGFLNGFT